MFALGIRYLTNRAVSARPGDFDAPEWPPHPARVFMAIVAGWAETGEDAQEREALEWIESLGAPAGISASPTVYDDLSAGMTRRSVTQYVPANDRAGPAKGLLQSAPGLTRTRSARTFPTVHLPENLGDDRVFLIWEAACPAARRTGLESLCEKVTRIGHSSSLVQMWVEADPPAATWVRSDDEAEIQLRTSGPGLLDRLEREYADDPARLPEVTTWQGYVRRNGDAEAEPAHTVWDAAFPVLRLEPLESGFRQLDLISILQLTAGLHRAVVRQVPDPVPQFVSGHLGDGSPSEAPHLGFLPLGFVGSQHADGLVRGIGLLLPRALTADQRRTAMRAVARAGDRNNGHGGLKLGRLGRWELKAEDRDPAPVTLRSSTWTGGRQGHRTWATVTPVVFDRHPKARGDAYTSAVAAMIREACENIGHLPPPEVVQTLPVSPLLGAPAAHEFPRMKRKDGSQRRHLHALIIFPEAIRGPIAIGAGRYRGYGILRPLRGER